MGKIEAKTRDVYIYMSEEYRDIWSFTIRIVAIIP